MSKLNSKQKYFTCATHTTDVNIYSNKNVTQLHRVFKIIYWRQNLNFYFY